MDHREFELLHALSVEEIRECREVNGYFYYSDLLYMLAAPSYVYYPK